MTAGKTILLVEDNEDDVFWLERIFKKVHIGNPLQIATDGQQAIDYLSGAGRFADRGRYPLPFIIFLDLKLPYVDGFEVLRWIRRQPTLDSLPVVILTGSDETKDHKMAYELGARSYLVKPSSPNDISLLLRSMDSHWSRPGASSPIVDNRAG